MTLIDTDGKVASCMVIGSSGVASLDAQSCAIVTSRARFRPALGLDGKPARSGKIQRIRWLTRP
jgi:protein TonB